MNDRVDVWIEGVGLALGHPVLGVGSGAYRTAAVETKHVAHNVFVSVLCELGLIGLLLFGVILAICFSKAIHHPRWYAWLWVTVLLVWSLGALVHTWEQRKQTWLFLGLVVVSSELFIRSDNSDQPRLNLGQVAKG